MSIELTALNSSHTPNWCPGCGNFGILAAVKTALKELGLDPQRVVLAGDVGCSGKLPFWVDTNGFTGLHGRVVALAQGIKMGDPKLTVLAHGGDGGIYGEGINHLISAARRNIDITVIVHNNFVYGLTTGQYSPTSRRGFKTKASPEGSFETPVNPLQLALVAGASFVARGFAGDIQHLNTIIKAAVQHPGFAIVDILQPCVSFNKEQTPEYYQRRVYKLEDTGYSAKAIIEALVKAGEWTPGKETSEIVKIPIGVFLKEIRATFPLKELVH